MASRAQILGTGCPCTHGAVIERIDKIRQTKVPRYEQIWAERFLLASLRDDGFGELADWAKTIFNIPE